MVDPVAGEDVSPRRAEAALRALGYARVPSTEGSGLAVKPQFWVQEGGVPRRRLPVFLHPDTFGPGTGSTVPGRPGGRPARRSNASIVVVPTERLAEEAWARSRGPPVGAVDSEVSILVVPGDGPSPPAHFHSGVVPRSELLRLATGIVVGLFRRAQSFEGSAQVDFEEMLELLKTRFRIDLNRSLGVTSDEEVMFILYQLAQRDAYAPGDVASNLHLITLRPTGPAARLPWFAA
ncbi:MAG TPA: hypothetical protein VFF67_05200 [Thermoplasmata archaeon]|nr:hypothetical protein [Thermoplasmata archaeon]